MIIANIIITVKPVAMSKNCDTVARESARNIGHASPAITDAVRDRIYLCGGIFITKAIITSAIVTITTAAG